MNLPPNWQEEFIRYLKKRPPLPGEKSHELVSLSGRMQAAEIDRFQIKPRLSAVAVVFEKYQSESYRILLIKRREYAGVHSAQISFPGGQKDGNEDLLQTSLRELYEELGIFLPPDRLLTPLTKLYIPPSNFLMYPFAYQSDEILKCHPDPSEVADVLYLPLQRLTEEPCFQSCEVDIRGFKTKVPAILLQKNVVWGATAMVLSEIHHLIKSFRTSNL